MKCKFRQHAARMAASSCGVSSGVIWRSVLSLEDVPWIGFCCHSFHLCLIPFKLDAQTCPIFAAHVLSKQQINEQIN